MKKLLLFAAGMLLCFSLSAQDDTTLKFKGIPVQGKADDFAVQLMKKSGFKYITTSVDAIRMTGTFMAYSNVPVWVLFDIDTDDILGVLALFEAGDNWPAIERKFDSVTSTYKKKYGIPSRSRREFRTIVYGRDELREKAIKDQLCSYIDCWEVEDGAVFNYINFMENKFYICCAYVNKDNIDTFYQDKILGDI